MLWIFHFFKSNNPLSLEQTSIFLKPSTMIHIYAITVVVVIVAGGRLIFDIITKKKQGIYQGSNKPKLTLGFIILGIVYILGGLFSSHYGFRTAFFGFIQIATLGFSYFYFYYTVDFKKVEKDYFGWLFLSIGILLSLETLVMLHQADFFTTTGNFSRDQIFTGWGVNNNVSGMLVMMIPIPIYFALEKKNSIVYLLIANILYIATILTQSRNGIFMGGIILLCSKSIIQYSAKIKKQPISKTIALILFVLSCLIK